ncbi:transcription regulator [Lactiplantibacillus plantarum]|nr:transcription regulator [Lactiplantibacillus plantarum]MCG0862310.1 transcription regulator [Lactiplantibacillus plantarum]
MTYTIKEVADKVGLSAYTLRFYDKQGLLPFVSRNESGYRAFTDGDLHLLHTIICLKNTGMAISAIRQYISYVMAGSPIDCTTTRAADDSPQCYSCSASPNYEKSEGSGLQIKPI